MKANTASKKILHMVVPKGLLFIVTSYFLHYAMLQTSNPNPVHLHVYLVSVFKQVRMAGSVATRNFLVSLPNDETRERFYPLLLPRLCLNR